MGNIYPVFTKLYLFGFPPVAFMSCKSGELLQIGQVNCNIGFRQFDFLNSFYCLLRFHSSLPIKMYGGFPETIGLS